MPLNLDASTIREFTHEVLCVVALPIVFALVLILSVLFPVRFISFSLPLFICLLLALVRTVTVFTHFFGVKYLTAALTLSFYLIQFLEEGFSTFCRAIFSITPIRFKFLAAFFANLNHDL